MSQTYTESTGAPETDVERMSLSDVEATSSGNALPGKKA